MKTIKHLERLRKMHQYIKVANTGTPKEFSKRLIDCDKKSGKSLTLIF